MRFSSGFVASVVLTALWCGAARADTAQVETDPAFPSCDCVAPETPACVGREDTYTSEWLQRDCSWTVARHRAEVSAYTVCLQRCQMRADESVRQLEARFACRSDGLVDCK